MSGWNESKKILKKELSLKNKSVLDVGCGNGWFGFWAESNGCQVDAIDPSESQIREAKFKDKENKINFLLAGAENINSLKNTYDLIFFFNSLHHIPSNLMEKSIEHCASIMNKNGKIIIIEPIAAGNFHNFVKNIDDETKVRDLAYKAIKNCKQYNLKINTELLYNELKTFNNGLECIEFLSKVDESRKNYIESNKDFLLNEFISLSNFINNKYEFLQPMRLNIISNIK
mgnify:CR=1 FL=1